MKSFIQTLKEFDWRVYKDDYEAGENKKRDGTKGKFFGQFY